MIGFYIIWIGFLLYVLLDTDPEDVDEGGDDGDAGDDDMEMEPLTLDARDDDDDDDDGKKGGKKKSSKKKKKKKGSKSSKRRMRLIGKSIGLMVVILVLYFITLQYLKTLTNKESLAKPTPEEMKQVKMEAKAKIQGNPPAPPAAQENVASGNQVSSVGGEPVRIKMGGVRNRLRLAVRQGK
mmetsp:Transcript_17370/g.48978  ORF Transcript_17370/g.48978 Transcript_17370/m.48978 type:complete len:182 (+) Transcript_17370:69-614(+)|eukprot:CAMPEP_0119548242 /NCGR_PEP_ID=MMETSP1352-20130426/2194_1 /TAXON_ID=265584 /ORGANISM="Stauroneis constricta, Strain CCMP1120" /LENGTH=181 /DNA_ID=CAMNT_0007593445 /DNA_START=58 /DNA_END=603 /DNA_ORIENTATION=-